MLRLFFSSISVAGIISSEAKRRNSNMFIIFSVKKNGRPQEAKMSRCLLSKLK